MHNIEYNDVDRSHKVVLYIDVGVVVLDVDVVVYTQFFMNQRNRMLIINNKNNSNNNNISAHIRVRFIHYNTL